LAKKSNVSKLKKRKFRVNIGSLAFLLILIAIVAGVIYKLNKDQIQIYEVQTIGLAKDNVVTGLILREETPISAKYSGYINYYTQDCVRVKKNGLILSLDETKEIYDKLVNANMSESLSDNDKEYIRNVIASYRTGDGLTDYSINTAFTDDISSVITELSGSYSSGVIENINLSGMPSTFHTVYAASSGLVSFNADKYSGLTLETVDSAVFSDAENYKSYTRRKSLAAAGDIVAKLITNDTWQILCPLNESQVKALKSLSSLPITINEDGLKVTLPFEMIEVDGQTCALFTLGKYIQNYLDYRYLSVQLNWEVSQGYKIPLSAITEKTFYIVPIEYFSKGGNSNKLGLIREEQDSKGSTVYNFIETTIYHEDGLYYYIDASDFKAGDKVMSTDGSSYTIGLTESLEGVYNINKGYAVFRRIERITQNSEYCIVKIGTAYGISLYDHISLEASDAVDSGIIY